MALTLDQYKTEKDRLELLVSESEAKLKQFTKDKVGTGGLVQECMRLTSEYRALYRDFDFYFMQLKHFNQNKECVKFSKQILNEKRKQLQK